MHFKKYFLFKIQEVAHPLSECRSAIWALCKSYIVSNCKWVWWREAKVCTAVPCLWSRVACAEVLLGSQARAAPQKHRSRLLRTLYQPRGRPEAHTSQQDHSRCFIPHLRAHLAASYNWSENAKLPFHLTSSCNWKLSYKASIIPDLCSGHIGQLGNGCR